MADVFRPAAASDLDAVAALYLRCARTGRENGTSDWDDDYPDRSFAADDLQAGGLYVLERDGTVIAAVTMLPTDDLDELDLPWTDVPHCALMRLAVEPALQGHGIGGQMTRLISDEARKRGYHATRHMSAADNVASTPLYRRLGYREVGTARLYDIDFICFERLL